MKTTMLSNVTSIYSIILIILLIILLLFTHNIINNITRSIIVWLMIYIIALKCTNTIWEPLIISVIITILLSIINCNHHTNENFSEHLTQVSSNKEGKEDYVTKKDVTKKDDDEDYVTKKDEDSVTKKDDTTKDNNTGQQNNFPKVTTDSILESKSLNLGELDLNQMLSDTSTESDKITSGNTYMTSSDAQKETFRLINTVKELDKTLKAISPTLTQGKNIIDMMKKLNL